MVQAGFVPCLLVATGTSPATSADSEPWAILVTSGQSRLYSLQATVCVARCGFGASNEAF